MVSVFFDSLTGETVCNRLSHISDLYIFLIFLFDRCLLKGVTLQAHQRSTLLTRDLPEEVSYDLILGSLFFQLSGDRVFKVFAVQRTPK